MDAIRTLPLRARPVLKMDESIRSVTAADGSPNTENSMTSMWVRSGIVLTALISPVPAMPQQLWWYHQVFEAQDLESESVEGSFYSGVISYQDVPHGRETYVRYRDEFLRQLEKKFGVKFYYWGVLSSSKHKAQEHLRNEKAECEMTHSACFFTNWVPGTELRIGEPHRAGKVTSAKDSNVSGPVVQSASAWRNQDLDGA